MSDFPGAFQKHEKKGDRNAISQGDFIQIDFLCTGAAKHIGKFKKYMFV